jgi:hypothetical protein
MLTAAICGDVFSAPSVNSILAVNHKLLILLFVMDLDVLVILSLLTCEISNS